jgi:hypothetical protein
MKRMLRSPATLRPTITIIKPSSWLRSLFRHTLWLLLPSHWVETLNCLPARFQKVTSRRYMCVKITISNELFHIVIATWLVLMKSLFTSLRIKSFLFVQCLCSICKCRSFWKGRLTELGFEVDSRLAKELVNISESSLVLIMSHFLHFHKFF